ncbi:MAG: aldehyde dehydrogenase family protein, partial [Planctomycetota bacterium]
MSTPAQTRSAESTGRDDAPAPAVATCFDRTRTAQPHWANLPLRQRLACLGRLRPLIVKHVDELTAPLDATHVRAPGESLAAEVLPLAEACRFLQKRAVDILKPRRHRTRMLPLWLAGLVVEVRHEPLGVVLVIGPSNYPLFLTGVQLVQALVAGNAVVVKPGRTGGEVLHVLARLLGAAGVPDGLVHVLDESTEAGHAAVAAGPDKVVLTGGLETGRTVLGELAETMTPAVMELSGCDAVLVHERSDPELVARCMAFGMRLNGGATCIG